MNRFYLLLALGMTVPAAGGYWLGRSFRLAREVSTSPPSSLVMPLTPSLLTAGDGEGEPLEARLTLLSRLEQGGVAVAESIFGTAFPDGDKATVEAAAQRWAGLDPNGFFLHLMDLDAAAGALHQVLSILFTEWARLDFMAALNAAEKYENLHGSWKPGWWTGEVLAEVMTRDPNLALTLAAAHRSPLPIGWIGDSWKTDPARFLKSTAALDESNQMLMAAVSPKRLGALQAWSGNDFPAALAWVRGVDIPLQMVLMPELMHQISPADLSPVMGWLHQLDPRVQTALMSQLVEKLALTDLPGAVALVEKMAPSKAREASGVSLAKAWAVKDPAASLVWIHDHLTGGRSKALPDWATAIPADQLPSAARLVEALPVGNGRDTAFDSLVKVWAKKDLPGALAWVSSLAQVADRRMGIGNLLGEWSAKDPAGLRDFIANAPPGELPANFGYRLEMGGSIEDQQNQIVWASTLPVDRRDHVFEHTTANFLANHRIEQSLELVRQIPVADLQRKAGSMLFKDQLYRQPGAAARLLEELPPALMDDRGITEFRHMVDAAMNLTGQEKESLLAKLQ